jgi:hypothetical protein
MALRSLIEQVRVDVAKNAHNCQANKNHRVERGDIRLKVRDGMGWVHYCQTCAVSIIDRDIAKLQQLRTMTPDTQEPGSE